MQRDSVWRRLTEDLSAMISQPVVEIIGTGRVLVENHKGISRYETECIAVRTAYGALMIIGSDMELVQITPEQLVISGKISGISLNGGAFHLADQE